MEYSSLENGMPQKSYSRDAKVIVVLDMNKEDT